MKQGKEWASSVEGTDDNNNDHDGTVISLNTTDFTRFLGRSLSFVAVCSPFVSWNELVRRQSWVFNKILADLRPRHPSWTVRHTKECCEEQNHWVFHSQNRTWAHSLVSPRSQIHLKHGINRFVIRQQNVSSRIVIQTGYLTLFPYPVQNSILKTDRDLRITASATIGLKSSLYSWVSSVSWCRNHWSPCYICKLV